LKVDIHNNGRRYTLLEDTYYPWDGVTVPAGFVTDFASVPKLFWWAFPPTGFYQRAALLHDYCYGHHRILAMSRWECDKAFRDQMKRDGVGMRTRYTMWLAVRLCGWLCWTH
jgi:hypothetical protein